MRKNRLAYFLLVSFFAFPIVSCGADKGENISLTIWHYYNNAQQVAFNELVTQFNSTIGKEKNITVTHKAIGYVNDLSKAVVDSASNKVGTDPLPDMFMAYADTAYKVDKLNKVAALDDYLTDDELKQYNQLFLQEGRFDSLNSLKIFPIAKSTELLFINKTDFDKFKNDPSNANKDISLSKLNTIDGLIEVSQMYYDWCGKAFYGRDSFSNYFIIGAKQLGIDLLDFDTQGKFYINFNEDVFRKLWDSYYIPSIKGLFAKEAKFRTSDVSMGTILCYTGSSNSVSNFPSSVFVDDKNSYEIQCDITFAPSFTKNPLSYCVQQGAGMVVSKSSKEKEAASVEFLKWFTDIDQNRKFAVDSSYMPVKNNAFTSEFIASITNTTASKAFSLEKQILEEATLYVHVTSDKVSEIRTVFDNTLDNKVKEVKIAIEEMVENGFTRDEAIQAYSTDEVFAEWFNSLKDVLNNLN